MRPALAVVLLAPPAFADDPAIPQYVAETLPAGLTHSFTGEWEFMVGGGAAAFDCSGDDKPDLLLAGGTSQASLWRNDSATGGALRFSKIQAGVELGGVTGAWPLDVDSDGITDLALLRVGENVLLRGLGDCRFERANEAWGFDGGDAWSTAFAATWERGEAWPTLAIGNYIDPRQDAFPWGSCTDNWLHRPEGSRFAAPLPLTPSFCALSILFTDWNRAGQPALRISNDREYYKGGQEQMWHLDPGAPPRLYTEAEGWQRLRIWGMGIASHDFDFDGLPEYVLTSMADNKFQVLTDPKADPLLPRYADVALAKGAVAQRPYTGGEVKPSTAWHTQIEDVNNDGRADIFIAKGNVSAMPDFAMADPNNLLLQRTDGTFMEAGDRAGVASMLTARGGAVVDLNADGWLDLLVVNRNAPAELWRNGGLADRAAAAHWIALEPQQPTPNQHAVNGWVEVRANGVTQRREITLGGGHGGGQLAPQHFGLGAAQEAEVRVLWPDGSASAWATLSADTLWSLPKDAAPVARR
ncbi:CRTAC1 family protein [Gemmobacter fulvus]|uniref:CRTAC1 family protein n=1 Tax=Gemmobacter fulvus TaxID=2840474 RepID=A0A975P6R8_9RHOB|nr:CRTAC1 family protein [Gemmobacter fulvus]MBT9245238.1 CRTAC1 family protein [Gemmobacter fulvus]QWK90432.1 CRTAC1 family protein [Gemmobacter fulvus]